MDYYSICCPYCESKAIDCADEYSFDLVELRDNVEEDGDEEEAICDCHNCNSQFKVIVGLTIEKEYNFSVEKITKKEDIIEDCPGQQFFWDNLELGGIRIY
jgi:hypothetical protein